MTEGMTNEDDRLLAAEYALGLLSAGEARAFEDLMAVSGDARRDFAFWAERLSAMTNQIAAVNPPAELRNRLNRIVKAQIAKEAPAEPAKGRGWGLMPLLAGGIVAASLSIWAVSTVFTPTVDAPLAMARLAAPDQSLVVEVAYAADRETLEITRTAGAPPDGQVFELWLLAEDGTVASLGVLPSGENGTLRLPAGLWPQLRGATCAISIEPPGGSPSGAPTGRVVALGPIVFAET